MGTRGHHLELTDRGSHHRHRWLAACTCGWSAPPMNLRRTAKRIFAGHRRSFGPGNGPRPKPLTPRSELPAELR